MLLGPVGSAAGWGAAVGSGTGVNNGRGFLKNENILDHEGSNMINESLRYDSGELHRQVNADTGRKVSS